MNKKSAGSVSEPIIFFFKSTIISHIFLLKFRFSGRYWLLIFFTFIIPHYLQKVKKSEESLENAFFGLFNADCEKFTKTDVSTGQLIPNCGIEILDKDGNVVVQGRTDDNGIVKFDMLRVGDYFYREFDAPDGYILDENSYPFTIKENGEIVKCRMTNTKIPQQTTPYTGDNSSDILAWIMIGLSLAIGFILIICKKKKGVKNEE